MTKAIRLAACLFLACSVLPAFAEDSPDASKFLGTFTITSGMRDGKALPKSDFDGSIVTIAKDKIYGTDKDKKEFFASTYTLDTTTKPWTLKMKSTSPKAGESAEGVVSVDGDTVKICYNLPGGKVPSSFKAGEKQHCFVLKRMTK